MGLLPVSGSDPMQFGNGPLRSRPRAPQPPLLPSLDGQFECDERLEALGTFQLAVTGGAGLPPAPSRFSLTVTLAALRPISSSSDPSGLVSGLAPPCS